MRHRRVVDARRVLVRVRVRGARIQREALERDPKARLGALRGDDAQPRAIARVERRRERARGRGARRCVGCAALDNLPELLARWRRLPVVAGADRCAPCVLAARRGIEEKLRADSATRARGLDGVAKPNEDCAASRRVLAVKLQAQDDVSPAKELDVRAAHARVVDVAVREEACARAALYEHAVDTNRDLRCAAKGERPPAATAT